MDREANGSRRPRPGAAVREASGPPRAQGAPGPAAAAPLQRSVPRTDPGRMDLADLRRLGCPHCGRPHDLLVLLDAAEGSHRAGPWATLHCPACGAPCALELAGETAALGRVEAVPRALFAPAVRVRQPGLRVRSQPDALVVELLHRRFVLTRNKA